MIFCNKNVLACNVYDFFPSPLPYFEFNKKDQIFILNPPESVNFSSTMSGLEILDTEDGTENTALPHNFTLSKIRSRGGREGDFNDDGANMISRLYYECLKLGRSKHSNETASQDGEFHFPCFKDWCF